MYMCMYIYTHMAVCFFVRLVPDLVPAAGRGTRSTHLVPEAWSRTRSTHLVPDAGLRTRSTDAAFAAAAALTNLTKLVENLN